jgi:hypothetical protein
MKIKLNIMFTIVAIITFLMGLGVTLAPALMLGSFGVDATPALAHMSRALGGAVLALAIITWMARNSGPSEARNALVVGLSLFLALTAIEDIRAILTGILNPIAWIPVILEAILLVLVIIAGRSAMSES